MFSDITSIVTLLWIYIYIYVYIYIYIYTYIIQQAKFVAEYPDAFWKEQLGDHTTLYWSSGQSITHQNNHFET